MPQNEVQVACAWCGLFSDPGPVCEVCGSPLPDVSSRSAMLSSSSFLTPEELTQLMAESPGDVSDPLPNLAGEPIHFREAAPLLRPAPDLTEVSLQFL